MRKISPWAICVARPRIATHEPEIARYKPPLARLEQLKTKQPLAEAARDVKSRGMELFTVSFTEQIFGRNISLTNITNSSIEVTKNGIHLVNINGRTEQPETFAVDPYELTDAARQNLVRNHRDYTIFYVTRSEDKKGVFFTKVYTESDIPKHSSPDLIVLTKKPDELEQELLKAQHAIIPPLGSRMFGRIQKEFLDMLEQKNRKHRYDALDVISKIQQYIPNAHYRKKTQHVKTI